MKVCHVIDHTEVGGAQRMLLDLIAARDPDVEMSVLSLREQRAIGFADRLSDEGASVTSLRLRRTDPTALFRLSAKLAANKYDIVHTHLDYSSTIGIAAALFRRSKQSAIVSHIHNDPWRQNGRTYRFVSRVLAPHIDAHVVPTPSISNAVQNLVGDRALRIACISPGIDGEYFNPASYGPHRDSSYRQGANRVVGFVGRLAEQKRLDVLLSAMPKLLDQNPATRLLVAGEGPLRPTLISQCRALEIEGAVRFVDVVEEIAPVYLAMDVLCLPSEFEGFGLVLTEAMAIGVPVVATDVIGVRDVVEHERTGLLVPPNDPDAIARAVTRIFDDETLRESLRETALDVVHKRFLREKMAQSVEALYREAIKDRSTNL